jgi:hypothetical protein
MVLESMVIITTFDEGTVVEQIQVDLNNDVSVPPEEDDFDINYVWSRGLRRPDEGIRCAGRSGSTRLLWLHKFYVVNEGTSSKRNCVMCMYQALQFQLGVRVPAGSVDNMTEESSRRHMGPWCAPCPCIICTTRSCT